MCVNHIHNSIAYLLRVATRSIFHNQPCQDLQIDGFIDLYHAILNKSIIQPGTRLINSRPNIQAYGIPGIRIKDTSIS